MCYAEAASPRITETSICAAQQLFNSSCWAVSRFSSGGILASAASKVPPTDCLGAKILPQNPEFTETLAGDILPQISLYTDCLGVFKGVHLSQVHQHSKRCTNIARGAPTEQEVHQPSKKCTNVARLGVCQNSQAVRPEGAEAHSPGQRPGYFVFIMNNAPCKGNTLIIRLLPLQGVGLVLGIFTQGAALGYVLLPLRGVTLASFDTP